MSHIKPIEEKESIEIIENRQEMVRIGMSSHLDGSKVGHRQGCLRR